MADKVQLIKGEIERRINNLKGYVLQKGSDQRWVTAIDQLTWIKAFIDSLPEELASEGLEEAMELSVNEEPLLEFFATGQPTIGAYGKDSLRNQFEAGAEWQKKKDQETIELAEDHAMLAGMNRMKEEMMKDAVEGTVKYEIGSAEIPQCDKRYQVLSDPAPITNAKLGDKVKILILKTE